MSRSRVALTVGVLTFVLAATASPSYSRDYTIRASNGAVAAIGTFHPSRNPTLRAAIAAFGNPTSRKARYGVTGCRVKWRRLKLTIEFANYGGNAQGACADSVGLAQSFVARSPRFRTWAGLRPRARSRTIVDKHPSAEFRQGSWWLRSAYSGIGEGGDYPVVRALVHAYRVTALVGVIGAAGE